MKKSVLFFATIWLVNLAYAQSGIPEEKFTLLFQERAKKEYKHIVFKVIDDLSLISYFNSQDYFHNLTNFYASYIKKTKDLDELLQDFIDVVQEGYALSPDYLVDTKRIVPVIRTAEQLADLMRSGHEFVYEKLNKDLVIMYAEDLEKGIPGYRFFTKEEFIRTGINSGELHDVAITNLKQMLPEPSKVVWEHKGIRNWWYETDTYGSKYISGLLLLADFLNSERNRSECDLIITIPSVSRIGIVGVKDKSGLQEIQRMSKQSFDIHSQRKTTPNLYRWDGSTLKKYRF